MNSSKFKCAMEIPILVTESEYTYIPVSIVFRRIASNYIDEWVMPNGWPRSDRDLAIDVIDEIGRIDDSRELSVKFDILDFLELDRAAALIVSTFLAIILDSQER